MGYAWVFWDLFALLVLGLLIRRGAAMGFVRAIISFFGYVAAAFLAGTLNADLARFLYDNVARGALESVIARQIGGALAEGAAVTGDMLDLMPGALRRVVQSSGGALIDGLFDGDAAALAGSVVDAVLREPVMAILGGVAFFIIFWLALLVVRCVSGLFTGLYKVPLLGTFNTFMGGVLGALQGGLVLFVLAMLMKAVIALTGNELSFLNDEVVDSTFIYRVFFHFG